MSRVADLYGAGLFLVYAVILFAHDAAPSMTDYANWTYQGVLLSRHVQGFGDAAHTLKHYPVPNSAATIATGMLALLLPWKVAAKLWLCMQMIICFVSLRRLAKITGASGWVWLIVPQAVFLGVNWWYGFVNFELGLAWVMLLGSLLLQRAKGRGGRDVAIGLVLVLSFFTHMIPFLFCGLMVVTYAAQTRRWRVLWQVVPSALLSAWYVAGRFLLSGNADGQAGMAASVKDYSMMFWAYKLNSYAKSFGFVNPGTMSGSLALAAFGRGLFLLLLLASTVLCLSMGWLMVRQVWSAYREGAPERFLWTSVLLLLPFYWFAPGTALGVSDPGSRLLQVSLAVALVLACRGRGRLALVSAGSGILLALGGAVLFVLTGFGPIAEVHGDKGLPHAVAEFAHVPNHDQDLYYRALESNDYDRRVFPTGIFLNRVKGSEPLRK